MNVGELKSALADYPDEAKFLVGISIPELFINTVANATITGDKVNPDECTIVKFIASASRNDYQQGPVQAS